MSVSVQSTIDTNHEDVIHDAQFDYYGKKLATCSSDRTIKIFDTSNDQQKKLIAELKGHDGPVWQVSWAHPQFGTILASCSYDHRVIIWKEQSSSSSQQSSQSQNQQQWTKLYEYKHKSSVNAIAWAPHEYGLILASASSDFTIKIVMANEKNNSWDTIDLPEAHRIGCNAISWAPFISRILSSQSQQSSQLSSSLSVLRFVSGGGDNMVKIWELNRETKQCTLKSQLEGHSDWVRDVAWANNMGLGPDVIASGSQDRTVIIHSSRADQPDVWEDSFKLEMSSVVWRLSWNLTGDILAVTTADEKVTLYSQNPEQQWVELAKMGTAQQQ